MSSTFLSIPKKADSKEFPQSWRYSVYDQALTFLTEMRQRQGSRTPVVPGAVILALKDIRAFQRTV